jgi:hypothetical protein
MPRTGQVYSLLPCPFCGSNNVDPEGWGSTDRAGPACDDCAGTADTVELWNTRPLEQKKSIEVDIGAAVAALQESPDLAAMMTEMVGGPALIEAQTAIETLCGSLNEMIEVYWADGDGELPEPQCITNARAALALAAYPIPTPALTSKEG